MPGHPLVPVGKVGRPHGLDGAEVRVGPCVRGGSHDDPLGSLDSSHERNWCSGRAPICVSRALPGSRRTSVGIDRTASRRLAAGLGSAVTVASGRLLLLLARPVRAAVACALAATVMLGRMRPTELLREQ